MMTIITIKTKTKKKQVKNSKKLITRCIDLGKEIRKAIVSDIKRIKNIDSVSKLKDFNLKNWLTNWTMALLQLLSSSGDIDNSKVGRVKIIVLSKIVELLYYTVNTWKGPSNHLLENLLCSISTNRKSYLSFIGNSCPWGSYTYLNNWLKEQGKEPLTYPSGLVKSVFNNSKKYAKPIWLLIVRPHKVDLQFSVKCQHVRLQQHMGQFFQFLVHETIFL